MSETGSTVVTRLLEQVFNKYVALDPEMPAKIAVFSGRVICLDITGLNKQVYLLPGGDAIKITAHCSAEPDTTITGSPASLIRLMFTSDSEPLLLSGEVEIKGDTKLARRFKKLFDEIDIDWEEMLSQRVGDVAAYNLVSSVRKLTGWGRYTGNAVMQDISEYLQEESRDVVTETELAIFNSEVDRLRDDTDRLAARIAQLMANGPADKQQT